MKPTRVQLRIDTLALPAGFSRHADALAAALRTELATLIGRNVPRSFTRSQMHDALDAGSVRLDPTTRADVLGARLARAVATSLGSAAVSERGPKR